MDDFLNGVGLSTGKTLSYLNSNKSWFFQVDGFALLFTFPKWKCRDFRISIQVGKYMNCSPRSDFGPWTHVEIGGCSESLLLEWKEEGGWIHPYVPISIIDTLMEFHLSAEKVVNGDSTALVLVDALRSEGVVTSLEEDPNFWTDRERFELAHGLLLLESFS